jgi:hypothetical protein
MKKLFLLVALVASVFTSAHANDYQCRSRIGYSSYSPKVLYYYRGGYYYEYRGGDYGPLYYYSNGKYYLYESKYEETVVLVPKAIKVQVDRDHYYSINSAARDDLLADAIVGRLLRMNKISGTPTPSTPTPSTPTPSTGTEDTGEDRAGLHQEPKLVQIITNSCAKCHGAGSKQTKLLTSDGKLTDLLAGKVWESFALVNSGEMPKGSKSLEDDDVKLFYEWAKKARKK